MIEERLEEANSKGVGVDAEVDDGAERDDTEEDNVGL